MLHREVVVINGYRSVDLGNGLYVCGDHRQAATLDGAMKVSTLICMHKVYSCVTIRPTDVKHLMILHITCVNRFSEAKICMCVSYVKCALEHTWDQLIPRSWFTLVVRSSFQTTYFSP